MDKAESAQLSRTAEETQIHTTPSMRHYADCGSTLPTLTYERGDLIMLPQGRWLGGGADPPARSAGLADRTCRSRPSSEALHVQ